MKCGNCGSKNDPKNKFCSECGTDLQGHPDSQALTTLSELYGKEVEVLFFLESYSGKISGIVNPTEDQVNRYREGIRQRVFIEAPVSGGETDENIGAVLTFIRQSKEYLGEKYDEGHYRSFSTTDLKKEYLKLFEKILRVKSKNTPMPTLPGIADKSDLKKL